MANLFEKLRNITNKLRGRDFDRINSEVTSPTAVKNSSPSDVAKRAPYFIQIGFDFGTSFSKCIYRDMMTQKAYIHTPSKNINHELPFLLPSIVIYKDSIVSCLINTEQQYPDNGLYHLKSALVKAALGEWSSPIMRTYKKITGLTDNEHLKKLIENCAVYYLGITLGEIRSKIRLQFPGFGSDERDYIAVNMAIPVGEAERPIVNQLFHLILTDAWSLAEYLNGKTSIELKEIQELRDKLRLSGDHCLSSACYVYPEVSANVQGFVRSRLSGEGIYLFSDTGAGTVDQSIFIFHRLNNSETLTYLCGRVLQLGSGQIELRAAEIASRAESAYLEELRKKKEQGNYNSELSKSLKSIEEALIKETEKTLATAAVKLHVRQELHRIKIIFGGGGYSENPYKRGVFAPFSGQLFSHPVSPEIISVPPPHDLELQDYQKRWMRRLSVAYGLSFEKGELARFIFPKDVPEPNPEEIWRPHREITEAPTMDQC